MNKHSTTPKKNLQILFDFNTTRPDDSIRPGDPSTLRALKELNRFLDERTNTRSPGESNNEVAK